MHCTLCRVHTERSVLYFAPTWLFWLYGLESDTVRYITVVKGVERCRTVGEIGHGLNSNFSLLNFTFSPVESEFAEPCKPCQTVLKPINPSIYVTLTDVSHCIDWYTVT